MIEFFEDDQDEFPIGDRVYLDYFNLYPELKFEETVEHLNRLSKVNVHSRNQTIHGWQIEAEFMGIRFLLDTHYHGTSTQFCVENSDANEETAMLAFLGCFLSTIRDDWKSTK